MPVFTVGLPTPLIIAPHLCATVPSSLSPLNTLSSLRRSLLAQREAFTRHPDFALSQTALGNSLRLVVDQMMPECLGVYWPLKGEFDVPAWLSACPLAHVALALPFALREPVQMHYRPWDGSEPTLRDGCGIPSVDGPVLVPDVVLVPCVGFTRRGFRLGFGAGYFDRWLAAHPHVTAVGVAWSLSELSDEAWQPQPHDQALMAVVTERGVVAD